MTTKNARFPHEIKTIARPSGTVTLVEMNITSPRARAYPPIHGGSRDSIASRERKKLPLPELQPRATVQDARAPCAI